MKQDEVYKTIEADQFFARNKYDFSQLPPKKKTLIDNYVDLLAEEKVDTVFEVGCHIGDLLNYAGQLFNSRKRVGIEPSQLAVKQGEDLFPKNEYITGVIAELSEIVDFASDLTIINDVFCWISRETLFQSINNIDRTLKVGGRLLIRDFYPEKFTANPNKHVPDHSVYCYKVPGSHGQLFLDSGKYKLIRSKVFDGSELSLSKHEFESSFEDRWVEMFMIKVA